MRCIEFHAVILSLRVHTAPESLIDTVRIPVSRQLAFDFRACEFYLYVRERLGNQAQPASNPKLKD